MRTLIAYFSWSNNTKKLIETINEKKKYDVIRIERAIPYSDDYDICAYKEAKEEVTKNIHPAIKSIDIDLNNYDRILLFSQSGGTHSQCPSAPLSKNSKAIEEQCISLPIAIPTIRST